MIYKQGDECTLLADTEEYGRLKKLAKKLTELSPNKNIYEVGNCYLDLGQDWMWTTILNKTQDYQALCPRDWLATVNGEDVTEIANTIFSDKYCPDR